MEGISVNAKTHGRAQKFVYIYEEVQYRFDVIYDILHPFFTSLSSENRESLREEISSLEKWRSDARHNGQSLSGNGERMIAADSITQKSPFSTDGMSDRSDSNQTFELSGAFKDFLESDESTESILELAHKYGLLLCAHREPALLWQYTIKEFKLADRHIEERNYAALAKLLSGKARARLTCFPKTITKRDDSLETYFDDNMQRRVELSYFFYIPDLLSSLWFSYIKIITHEAKLFKCLNPNCQGEKWFYVDNWDARMNTDFCKECAAIMPARIYRAGQKWKQLDHDKRADLLKECGLSELFCEEEWKNIHKTGQLHLLPLLMLTRGRPSRK